MSSLNVYEVLPARPHVSTWAARILGPAISRCRFRGAPPPVEFGALPAGTAGLARGPAGTPGDGRVHIAHRSISFWTEPAIVATYVHEVAHRLCYNARDYDEGHGPIFFAVLFVLSARIDLPTGVPTQTNLLSLYDFSDRPVRLRGCSDAVWRAEVLAFAHDCAAEFAGKNLAAEDLPTACADRWVERVDRADAGRAELKRLTLQLGEARAALDWERRNKRVRGWLLNRLADALERHPVVVAALCAASITLPLSLLQLQQIITRLGGRL